MKTFAILALLIAVSYGATNSTTPSNSTITPPQGSPVCNATGCSKPLNLATFNADLSFFTPSMIQRGNALFKSLQNSSYDAICLNGIWDPTLRTTLVNNFKANSKFSSSLFAPQVVETCDSGCTTAELQPVQKCMNDSGCTNSTLNTTSVFACAQTNCASEFAAVSLKCQKCLELISTVNIVTQMNTCNATAPAGNSTNSTCGFLFGGWSDNLLMSTHPFTTTDFTVISSPAHLITVLYGQISVPDIGTVNLFCTHLEDEQSVLTADLNAAQTSALLSFIKSKVPAGSSQLTVIMGDTVNGPAVGSSVGAVFGESYDNITGAGFTDTYIVTNNTGCTQCAANAFPTVSSGNATSSSNSTTLPANSIVDHIFINQNNSKWCITSSKAIVSAPVSVNGTSVGLSDHTGIATVVCAPQDVAAGGSVTQSATTTGSMPAPTKANTSGASAVTVAFAALLGAVAVLLL